MDLVVIGGAALLTAVLSAVAGLGGGVILLGVLAQFFAPTTAVPIQGAIQLMANGSRAALLRSNIAWAVVGRAAILLLPASLLGAYVASSVPEDATRLLLGGFVLMYALRPAWLAWRGSGTIPPNALIGVGALSGFLNTTVGASGPFTAAFFKAATASHVAFVATAATSQIFAHAAKLVAFGLQGFAIQDHLDVIAVGVAGVVAGSWIGARLLGRISEDRLAVVFRLVLIALGVRLLARALL
ncbi:MAG: sulfite exporter TauE/SafE family protein [Acidimicrobiales bacterium]|nr:sulfite exporter TauE/SafE family protein [Acidimicrobiales bacterium]